MNWSWRCRETKTRDPGMWLWSHGKGPTFALKWLFVNEGYIWRLELVNLAVINGLCDYLGVSLLNCQFKEMAAASLVLPQSVHTDLQYLIHPRKLGNAWTHSLLLLWNEILRVLQQFRPLSRGEGFLRGDINRAVARIKKDLAGPFHMQDAGWFPWWPGMFSASLTSN